MTTCTEEKFQGPFESMVCLALIPGARTVVTALNLEGCSRNPTTLDDNLFHLGEDQVMYILLKMSRQIDTFMHPVLVPYLLLYEQLYTLCCLSSSLL